MADIIIRGFLDKIHFLPNQSGGILQVSEFRKGYRKGNGVIVDDKYITWKVLFKHGQASFVNKYFNTGMLVKVKGEVLPYAIEHDNILEGYTVLMDSCSVDSYPRSGVKRELSMIKDSQLHGNGTPDLDSYNEPDF